MLYLHHQTQIIGIVKGFDEDINPKIDEVYTSQNNHSEEDSFPERFSQFYHQLKNPEEFSFFKVTEYDAEETVQNLQNYINHASAEDKKTLENYAVSIETVEARIEQDQQTINPQISTQRYRYNPDLINWDMMAKVGLNPENYKN